MSEKKQTRKETNTKRTGGSRGSKLNAPAKAQFQNSPKDLVLSINLFTFLNALLQKHNLNRTSTIAKPRYEYP